MTKLFPPFRCARLGVISIPSFAEISLVLTHLNALQSGPATAGIHLGQDLGVLGLRQAKQAWRLDCIYEKFRINLRP